MLKLKPVSVFFFVLFIATAVGSIFFSIPNYIFYVILLGYLLLLAYGSIFIRSGFYVKAYCEGITNENKIALTFDDGPDETITPQVLDLLKEHDAKGAFFCIGHKIEQHPEIINRMDREDHLIGNHSYSHSNFFDFYPKREVIAELRQTEDLIEQAIGKKTSFFRPPYGVTNPPIKRAVSSLNYKVIGWSVRSMDTMIKNEDKLLERVTKQLKPGSVVLFHDSNPRLPAILKRLLGYCAENGIKCVGLDELLNLKAYV